MKIFIGAFLTLACFCRFAAAGVLVIDLFCAEDPNHQGNKALAKKLQGATPTVYLSPHSFNELKLEMENLGRQDFIIETLILSGHGSSLMKDGVLHYALAGKSGDDLYLAVPAGSDLNDEEKAGNERFRKMFAPLGSKLVSGASVIILSCNFFKKPTELAEKQAAHLASLLGLKKGKIFAPFTSSVQITFSNVYKVLIPFFLIRDQKMRFKNLATNTVILLCVEAFYCLGKYEGLSSPLAAAVLGTTVAIVVAIGILPIVKILTEPTIYNRGHVISIDGTGKAQILATLNGKRQLARAIKRLKNGQICPFLLDTP